jgi:hypothetical protein
MMKTINTFTVPDDWDGKLHGLAAVATKARFPCIGQRCWDNPHAPISPYTEYEWHRWNFGCTILADVVVDGSF